MNEATEKQINAADKALDKIQKIHECDWENRSTRISTPGFEESGYQGIGVSTWACDVCAPMIVDAFTKICGEPPFTFRKI